MADEAIDQDRCEQHRAQEDLEPVRVDAGEDDALLDQSHNQRAEEGADGRPVPTGRAGPLPLRGTGEEVRDPACRVGSAGCR